MASRKLFKIKRLPADELPSVINTDDFNSYYFSVVWIKRGIAISLSSVAVTPSGTNNWKQLLGEITTENDGEIDVPMGVLKVGDKLDLIFNLFPHQDVTAAAIYLTNHNTGVHKQIKPATG